MNPFRTSGLDALAQCPRCLRTWTYDALDALLDRGKQKIEGYESDRNCRNCKIPAKLFQSLESVVKK